MSTIVELLLAYLAVQGAGYLVHRLAHWPGGGSLYRAHQVHHAAYPPSDFVSDVYRAPGRKESSVLGFLPYHVALCALGFLILRPAVAFVVAIAATLIGWANSYVHDGLHVRGFWLERFGWFHRLRALHLQHHRDVATNLGIFSWLWDRLAGSFRAPVAAIRVAAAHPDAAPIGRLASERTQDVLTEFLVAIAVAPAEGEVGRIEVHTVFATDAAAAMRACSDPARGIAPQSAVPLRGDVLAVWNELGRVAFGFSP
jgi:hypothetical protein